MCFIILLLYQDCCRTYYTSILVRCAIKTMNLFNVRAAGMYEDMRTGLHHVFGIEGGKPQILSHSKHCLISNIKDCIGHRIQQPI